MKPWVPRLKKEICFSIKTFYGGRNIMVTADEKLALTSILAATVVIALVSIGSGGKVVYGFFYIPPAEEYFVALIPYFFIFLSIHFTLRVSDKEVEFFSEKVAIASSLIGYYMALMSAMLYAGSGGRETLVSFLGDSVVALGSILHINFKSVPYVIRKFLSKRDIFDKIIVSLAFLILGFSRVVSKDVPLSVSLIFYGMSWFIWLLILYDFAEMFKIRNKGFVIRLNFLVLFAIANLAYAILIILSV